MPHGVGWGKHLAVAAAVRSLRRMLRLALCCLLCAGCAIRPSAAPEPPSADALVIAFVDGFHSGVVLERAPAPARLLPPATNDRPWVVLHFGERRWISGEADGLGDALRLACATGDGGVQVDAVPWWVHDRGGTDPSRLRVWAFPVSGACRDALWARLDSWVGPGPSHPLPHGGCWWPSPRRWSVWCNCHDFTADLLGAAGIAVSLPPLALAGALQEELDRAWALADAAGLPGR